MLKCWNSGPGRLHSCMVGELGRHTKACPRLMLLTSWDKGPSTLTPMMCCFEESTAKRP